LRFLAQSNCNCNVIEKFGGVIVIVIIFEQIWCNWSNSDSFHYKVLFPSPQGGLLWANLPQTKLQVPPKLKYQALEVKSFCQNIGYQAPLDKRKDPYWKFSDDGSAKFYGRQEGVSNSS